MAETVLHIAKTATDPFAEMMATVPFAAAAITNPFAVMTATAPIAKMATNLFAETTNETRRQKTNRAIGATRKGTKMTNRAGVCASRRFLSTTKPIGTVVSRVPLNEGGGKEAARPVFDDLPDIRGGRWLSVGRLDVNTEGLLLFVDDGDLANRLAHPRYGVQREYLARVSGELSAAETKNDFAPALLTKRKTLKADSIRPESEDPEGGRNKWYRLQMSSGKYRAIRRLFAFFGLRVSRLKRVRMGPFELPRDLASGDFVFADAALLAGEDMVNVREQPPLPEPANAALFDGEDENENADASESESESAEASANENRR